MAGSNGHQGTSDYVATRMESMRRSLNISSPPENNDKSGPLYAKSEDSIVLYEK